MPRAGSRQPVPADRRPCSKQVAAEEEPHCHACGTNRARTPRDLPAPWGIKALCFCGRGCLQYCSQSPEAVPNSFPSLTASSGSMQQGGEGSSSTCRDLATTAACLCCLQCLSCPSLTWGQGQGALPAPLDSLLPPVHLCLCMYTPLCRGAASLELCRCKLRGFHSGWKHFSKQYWEHGA